MNSHDRNFETLLRGGGAGGRPPVSPGIGEASLAPAPVSKDKKPVVVWNMTRRCNLKCIHCYSSSQNIALSRTS